jgi:hypothetical protein
MREIRTSGSEGGVAQANAPFLPLSRSRRGTSHTSAERRTELFSDQLFSDQSLMPRGRHPETTKIPHPRVESHGVDSVRPGFPRERAERRVYFQSSYFRTSDQQ